MPPTNFKKLDLNLLRVFDEVMTERSLTRAARKLSITQPAVSNALRRLREAMGDELIKRSGQAMAPTPRGLAVWPAVREALRQLQDVISPSTFVPGEAQATFVLAMADATSANLLPGLMAVLERDAPQLSIRVVPLVTRDPRPLLEQDGADLAIGYFPSVLGDLTARAQAGETVAFATQRLFSGEYVCAMRQGHPLTKGPLTLNRFCSARHVLVSYSGRPFGFIDEALAVLGRERQIALTVNQFFTAGTLAAQSDLLTGMPRHFLAVSGLQDQLILRDLPFAVPPLNIDALWHHRRNRDSAHDWLRRTIAGVASTQSGT
ncbi:LysR family transcriptional regulator [Rhodoferax sp. PAMC 29310]|uniref:LysR family transcriptional regulator n=1 Tax=Rhodoferax sp. PAMC 29310 TaxID=2822760 RepID=UPI001B32DFF0|nr:LysR family transcriptional regulator [Rhodoferax sp. PAMC 29310]